MGRTVIKTFVCCMRTPIIKDGQTDGSKQSGSNAKNILKSLVVTSHKKINVMRTAIAKRLRTPTLADQKLNWLET